MLSSPTPKVRKLPGWLKLAGSVVVAAHLFALGILALSAPSGPWPTIMGESMGTGPKFATIVGSVTTDGYLKPLGMSHNYHFLSNRVALPSVYFRVLLKDKSGAAMKELRFPNANDNFWVRHRHSLLARGLGDDQRAQLGDPERVGKSKRDYWLTADEVRRLFAHARVHNAFVVEYAGLAQLLKGSNSPKADPAAGELHLNKINRFYPLSPDVTVETVENLIAQKLIGQPWYVPEGNLQSLKAMPVGIPVLRTQFFQAGKVAIERLRQDGLLEEPYVFAEEEAKSTGKHFYRMVLRVALTGKVEQVAQGRMVSQPSKLSLILARSFVRHLCRKHGAHAAEIIRHHRQTPPPERMYGRFPPNLEEEFASEMVAHFGDLQRHTEENVK